MLKRNGNCSGGREGWWLSVNRVQHYVTHRPAKGPGPQGPSEHLRRLRHAYGTHPSPRSTQGNDTADPMRQAGRLLVPLPRRGSRWQTRTSCTYHNWEAVPGCCRSCGNIVPRHRIANMCWASCSDDNCPADQEHLHNCVPTPPPPPPPPPVSQRPQCARVPPPPPPPPAPRPSCGVLPWEHLTRQPRYLSTSTCLAGLSRTRPPHWSSWRRLACINLPTRFACCICRLCGTHA